MILKRVGILSCAKLLGVLYGVLGLIFGAFISLFSVIASIAGFASDEAEGAIVGLIFGIGAVVILPIFYGIMGFLGGALTAAIYNLAARFTGGIELELETAPTRGGIGATTPPAPPPTAG